MAENAILNYRIIVTTCDRYLPAIPPFAHLLNKYWLPNPQVIVAGFAYPSFSLPPNFEFVSLGRQEDFPFNRWSDALYSLLVQLSDEVFVLMLEDYWITRQVDSVAVEMLADLAINNKDILKIDLCGDRLYAYGTDLDYGALRYLDLIKSMPGSPYHMSLMTGLWRRDNLIRCLVPGESPHDLEIVGTTRVSHMQNLIVLGTRQWPVRHTLALRNADVSKLITKEMSVNDIDELRALGMLSQWGVV